MWRVYSVLVAEPNHLLREKIAGVLTRRREVWCVSQVPRKEHLLQAATLLQPDFVLADISMLADPQSVHILRRASSDSRIIALVDSRLGAYREAARTLGLDRVFEKGRVGEGMVAEIQAMFKSGGAPGEDTS